MTESKSQHQFLSTVKEALGHPGRDERRCEALFGTADAKRNDQIRLNANSRSRAQRLQLLETLIETGRPLNLKVTPVKHEAAAAAAIAKLAAVRSPEWGAKKSITAWQHPLIDELDLPEVLADQQIPVFSSAAQDPTAVRRHIIDSFIGVTSADYCVADTATLVLRTRPAQARATSLLPSIHVAVIYLEQIIADLPELYALLSHETGPNTTALTNCMTFITGPSKTADIELCMVHGAHGPREVHIIVVTES